MADVPTLAAAVDALYAVPPAGFVHARAALVAEAKESGDTELAGAIKVLRKPSVSAYLINRLVRDGSEGIDELRDLGGRLRDAQSRLDGSAMKALAADRNDLVARLTVQACSTGESGTPTTREQVAQTLTAAIADPAAQAALDSGALVGPLRYSGFGDVDLSDAIATPLRVIQGGRVSGESRAAGADRAVRDSERQEAQQLAAQRAAQARLTRLRAGLERADHTVDTSRESLAVAQTRLEQAQAGVRYAKNALTQAQTERRMARDMVTATEAELEARS